MPGNRVQLFRRCALVSLLFLLGGCMFSVLDDDLERMGQATHLFAGETVVFDNNAVEMVVVGMHDADGKVIAGFRMMSGAGRFELRAERRPTWIFAFHDLNHDLIFQRDEPYAWARNGQAVDPTVHQSDNLEVRFTATAERAAKPPKHLVDEPLEDKFGNYVNLSIGTVTPLDSPLFSVEQAEKGLWQPFRFAEDGGAGVHFLEEYDPQRIPVLFVHGINGTPRNFADLIDGLDKSRYQVWVVSYPSGMRLSWVARGIYQVMQVLHVQLKFDELHVVAHSMGGLVSRGTLNICAENRSCRYLRSYTTVSTPWNGVASAENGTRWSPTVVPVWWDLVPSSEYVTTLFDQPLPRNVRYHLLFGYRNSNNLGGDSSDGVIRLTSQLRLEAQQAAQTTLGVDAGHVDILRREATLQKIYSILDAATP